MNGDSRSAWWVFTIKRMLFRFPNKLEKENTRQSIEALKAIREAIQETQEMRDGPDRLRMISLLYFRNTHTQEGAARELHISTRTAQRWNQDFIFLVGEKLGYR